MNGFAIVLLAATPIYLFALCTVLQAILNFTSSHSEEWWAMPLFMSAGGSVAIGGVFILIETYTWVFYG